MKAFGWKGEWWVLAQFILVPVVLLAAVGIRAGPPWPVELRVTAWVLGGLCFIATVVLGMGGILNLGRNLTPFPRPLDDGTLVQSGVYGIVRHPIYGGVILGVLGWALLFTSIVGIVLAGVVLLFFDQKSRREEVWLMEKYRDYAAYRRRVRKLIPFIY
ncbi:MAG: isoprenylcysteine carboxylmethyltransferase family protein [Chloroflexi bacterium]|nr:isoprenylcysteine carboxylmethyltransferase family protein [Chloroflexota bacterium]